MTNVDVYVCNCKSNIVVLRHQFYDYFYQ